MSAKTSSQNINSLKTVLLQLESSWMVEKLMFFHLLYENGTCFLKMLLKTSTRSKKGEKFRIILQTFPTFFNLLTKGPCHSLFYSLWTAQSFGLRIILQKRRRITFGTRLLDLKLRKTVLQNYLIFAHKGFSGPSANPRGWRRSFSLFCPSLWPTHATETALTKRLEHAKN